MFDIIMAVSSVCVWCDEEAIYEYYNEIVVDL